MIKATSLTGKTTRETTAVIKIEENGEQREETVNVIFKSFSVQDLKNHRQMLRTKGDDAYLSDVLLDILDEHGLPDIVDAKNKPVKITLEFLEQLSIGNLRAIKDAIDETNAPK